MLGSGGCLTRRGDDARRLAGNLQALLELDQLGDAIVHLLDGIEFGQTHATLVGDVVDTALGLGVLTAGSAHLQVVLGGNLLQLDEMKKLAEKYRLQIRGTSGEHSEAKDGVHDISNQRRMGLTEYEIIKEMHDGIKGLIEAECKARNS